jgi:signal transduction histidine kinase
MQMTIRDDGAGFDPRSLSADTTHWGFAIMRERARALDATLEIQSAPDEGTRISLRMARRT